MDREPHMLHRSVRSCGFFALCLAAFMLLPSALRSAGKGSNWIEVRSPHFIVESNSGKDHAKAVAQQFEMIRGALDHAFSHGQMADSATLTILAVDSEYTLHKLLPDYFTRKKVQPVGVFMESQSGPYIILRTFKDNINVYEPSFHEYTHYFMRQALPFMPLWLGEGMADLFSNIQFSKHNALMGLANPGDMYVLKQRPMIPIRTLLSVDASSPYYNRRGKTPIFYAESWALTHYLVLSDVNHHTQHVAEYTQLVARGGDPVETFIKVFGPLEGLQDKLDRYISQFALPAFRLPLSEHVSSRDLSVRHLSRAEADADQAEFLLVRRHAERAKALINEALEQDPRMAKANALKGLLLIEEGKRSEAFEWAKKAIQLDPKDYRGYFFAAMAMRGGDLAPAASAEFEKNLKQAISLRPCLVVADSILTNLYLRQDGKTDQALDAAADAVRCEPENDALLTNLEIVLLKKDRLADAVRIETQMLARAHTPKAKAMVRNDLGWRLLEDNVAIIRADHEIKTAVKLDPGNAAIQDSLGYLLKKENKLPGSEDAFRHALSIQPKLVSSLEGLGDVLRSEHKLDGAIAEYQKALAIAPNNDRIHYHLSLALKAKGDFGRAASELKAARKINPYNPAYQ